MIATKRFLFSLLLSISLLPAYGQTANADVAAIDQNTDASLDVLKNDFAFFGINKGSVDLDPDEDKIQHSLTTVEGKFSSDKDGIVTFKPKDNFTGEAKCTYTFKDNLGLTSNSATITITVRPVNDVPEITGQNPVVIQEGESRELLVTDLIIDDQDDSEFTLLVQSGQDYTVSETTITPAANFSGSLTVNVKVSDGDAESNSFALKVTVNPVNGVPEITGQSAIAINEDQSRTIRLADLTVSDTDNTYPNGFTLTVLDGTNYTATAANVMTPAANFYGTLTVNVKVNDGTDDSNVFGLTITVNPVNDVPVITGQIPLSIGEAKPLALTTAQLKVSDPDNDYPDGFTLSVLSGANYSLTDNVVTPVANFSGTLQVKVFVNDGAANSAVYILEIQVNPSNDAPVIKGQKTLQINEDATITLKLTDLTVTDPDDDTYPTGFTLKVAGGTNYTVSSTTVTPKANFSGTLTVPVRVNDGNSDSAPFDLQVQVAPINDAPTLDAVTVAAIKEGAALQSVALKGITAGPLETQDLTVTVVSNKPELFETLNIVYTSPQTTGTLRIKPKANANGTAQITVTVQDSGLGTPAPNVNNFKRVFNLTIQPVNDAPVFQSEPVLTASANEPYTYNVVVTDADGETLTLTAPTKPSWLTFTVQSNGKAKLSGTPPATVSGTAPVKLSAKDASGDVVAQSFTITINGQPVVKPIAIQTQEDKVVPFTTQLFADAFTDPDGDALAEINITTLPRHGILKLNDAPIQDAVTLVVAAADIGRVTYTPAADYSGYDTLRWNGSDGTRYGKKDAYVSITIAIANDPPTIEDLETDTLAYEVGNETPRLFTTTFRAADVDDDSLTSAEVGFRRQNHNPLNDRLIFASTENITGTFDSQAGILSLAGKAPLAEYTAAIRSIEYNYINMNDMALDIKNIYITLNDGKTFGETKNREIALIYTFKDLDIPTGFTPNGDNANDYWKITSVKGTEQYNDAEIRVFNRRGQMLYESVGFETPWDGTFNGERLPVDSYYYTIDLKYSKIQYKGVVTILR